MATPDISALKDTSDVFSPSHTLPQIRGIHKAIHAQLDEKAARLRSQVGNSYRELLGTADAIVRMKEGNDEVQRVLGGMGARCGRSVVGSKVNGLGAFVGTGGDGAEGAARTGEVARLQLLEGCILAVSRVLRGGAVGGGLEGLGSGDRLVLATKLLILARLLIKSFGDRVQDEHARTALASVEKNRLALRRKLARCVGRVLERCGEDTEHGDILKALAAYSLDTNSGARDSLKHFLIVREKAMKSSLEADDDQLGQGTKDVLAALNFYTKTLLDVQAIAPFNLAEALGGLKRRPLLADVTIQKLEILRLDIYERWCGEDMQEFTPFIRHDDLEGTQAKEMLTSWAEAGSDVLVAGLEKALGTMSEFKSIVDLRTRVLRLWIRDGTKVRGFDPSEMLDRLRQAVNTRLLAVLETKVNKLHLVGSEIAATLDSWNEGTTDAQPDLWDESTYDMELSGGVKAFLQDVMARMYGRNDAVSKIINCYGSWWHVIDDVKGVVEHLGKQRWDDDIDDLEDDDAIEARQEALSKEDPAALRERLDATLETAFKALEEKLKALWGERKDGPNSGRMAMFFVRVLRDVRTSLPKIESVEDFGLEMVPSLHDQVARQVCTPVIDEFVGGPLTRTTVVGRALWEGEPEAPSVPTPGMFMFLRDLSREMGKAGMDLWSPTAVKVLKGVVSRRLCGAWEEALRGLPETNAGSEGKGKSGEKNEEKAEEKRGGNEADGESEAGDKTEGDSNDEAKETEGSDAGGRAGESESDERRDLLVQWFFDISYLQCCLGSANGSEWESLAAAVFEEAGLDGSLRARLTKSAEEYWKRTSLLFGLLA